MSKISKRIHFEQIESTNTWAKSHPEEWSQEGITLITASEQSGGRGRFKRQWFSPPGVNIYATFCFWLNIESAHIGHLPQILAISAAEVIEGEGFSVQIKWPNDLLLNGKKIGGILCETILESFSEKKSDHQEKLEEKKHGKERRGVICGIGMNINMIQEQLEKIDRPATSLFVASQRVFDIPSILTLLGERFSDHLKRFQNEGFAPFFPFLKDHSPFKSGDNITFHDNQTLIKGKFIQLKFDGSVELCLSDGTIRVVHAGEFIC